MSARWKVGLALLALPIAGQLWAQPLAPRARIVSCASRAGPMPHGISALNKACPGIEDALTQLQLTAFMPPGWRRTVTAGGLFDVDNLLQRYSRSQPSAPPRAAVLRSIAAGLAPRQAPLTWLGRVEAWMRRSLLQPARRWLRSLGSELQSTRHPRVMLFGFIALLLAAVVAVLAFELRRSGPIRPLSWAMFPPRRGRAGANRTGTGQGQAAPPDWTQLRAHPARVLRLLVDTLTRARRLERDRHLTCRELEMQVRLDTAIERAGFAQVARLAERELYGPPGMTLLSDEALREAQALYARLSQAAANGRAVAR